MPGYERGMSMRSASMGQFGVLFVGLVVGLILGRLWTDSPSSSGPVLYAAVSTKAGVPSSLDQVQEMLALRQQFLADNAPRFQREMREVLAEQPIVAHYLSLQEIASVVLLGTLGQIEPRVEFCEHRGAVTQLGALVQSWVCRDGRVCAPDVLEAYRALAACDGAEEPDGCGTAFEAVAGRPPLRSEPLVD